MILILVASHLCYEGQPLLLFACLRSLLRQTHRDVRVCASVSFENDGFRAEFERVVQDRLPTVRFTLRATQTYQMEHLRGLAREHLTDGHRYEYVCFCDDDDTYHPQRVACMLHVLRSSSDANPHETFYGAKEVGVKDATCGNSAFVNLSPEFWSYMIRPDVLTHFFRIMDGFDREFLRNRFSDMIFRQYLRMYRRGDSKVIQFCTCDKCEETNLYLHNDHAMSVTKRASFAFFVGPGAERDMFEMPDVMSFLILKCMGLLLHLADPEGISGEELERWDLIRTKLSNPLDPNGVRLREMADFLRQFMEL